MRVRVRSVSVRMSACQCEDECEVEGHCVDVVPGRGVIVRMSVR